MANCSNWVDVKAAEGIEGVDEEEGTRKVVVNHKGGQVTNPHQSEPTKKEALLVSCLLYQKITDQNLFCVGDCEERCAPDVEIRGGKQGGDQEQRPAAGV